MDILIVFVLPCYMAAVVRSAPLPEVSGDNFRTLVDKDFYLNVDISLSMLRKIVLSVPETHRACVNAETMDLNSEKEKFALVAEKIGIPAFPVLHVLSENSTVSLQESSLVQMQRGLLLHRALLGSLAPRLAHQDSLTELLSDTRDLLFHMRKLLRTLRGGSTEPPAAVVLDLRLSGEFDVQVAAHVTLQNLQDFGRDMERILRRVAESEENEDKDESRSPESEQLR